MKLPLNERGFETAEKVMLSVIILFCLAITVPSFLDNREKDDSIQIRMDLRAFHTANLSYFHKEGLSSYAANLEELINAPSGLKYLDLAWQKSLKNGFQIDYTPSEGDGPKKTFSMRAWRHKGILGKALSFCVDQKGIIYGADGADTVKGTPKGCEGGKPVV